MDFPTIAQSEEYELTRTNYSHIVFRHAPSSTERNTSKFLRHIGICCRYQCITPTCFRKVVERVLIQLYKQQWTYRHVDELHCTRTIHDFDKVIGYDDGAYDEAEAWCRQVLCITQRSDRNGRHYVVSCYPITVSLINLFCVLCVCVCMV